MKRRGFLGLLPAMALVRMPLPAIEPEYLPSGATLLLTPSEVRALNAQIWSDVAAECAGEQADLEIFIEGNSGMFNAQIMRAIASAMVVPYEKLEQAFADTKYKAAK